jgi:hypothetical protein
LALGGERFVYDVRAAKALGRRMELSVTVDPYEPAIFAIAPAAMPGMEVSAPTRVKRGETAELGVSFAASSPAAWHVLHVDVVNPSGQVLGYYSGNLLASQGRGRKFVPVAVNDPAGRWEIRVRDLLTGQSRTSGFEVF